MPKRKTKAVSPHEQQAALMLKEGYVTVDEAARICRVHRATVYGWVRAIKVTSTRVGHSVYILRESLREQAGPLFNVAA